MSGGTQLFVDQKIQQRRIMLWTKRYCSVSTMVKELLKTYSIPSGMMEHCDIDRRHDCAYIETYLLGLCLDGKREDDIKPLLQARGDLILETCHRASMSAAPGRASSFENLPYSLHVHNLLCRHIPRMFVKNHHVASGHEILRLHETGELAEILRPITSLSNKEYEHEF